MELFTITCLVCGNNTMFFDLNRHQFFCFNCGFEIYNLGDFFMNGLYFDCRNCKRKLELVDRCGSLSFFKCNHCRLCYHASIVDSG